MTTYVYFQPSNQAPFQFQATLDGSVYNAYVPWNTFGQRYYLRLFDLSGNLIFNQALIGSPSAIALESLTWSQGNALAETAQNHGYTIGAVINLTIAGVTPSAYNGTFECLITGPATFSYELDTFPGVATALGAAAFNINLAAPYFTTSSLVYREAAQQFEINS